MVRVALDMMGGDNGVDASVRGVHHYVSALKESGVFFHLFGDGARIMEVAEKISELPRGVVEIHDTGERVISPDEQPSHAVRNGSGSSMFEAISHVSLGRVDAVVSSGNTGAYMALSKIMVGMIEEMSRPAIVGIIPNIIGKSVMLDLGANTDCSSMQLVQFAVMGVAVARVLLDVRNPTVGLLNIGTEKSKGTDQLCKAYQMLESMDGVSFLGFVEGTDINKGTTDVIVTDGFSGNIALKTIEGTMRYLAHLAKVEVDKSLLRKIACLLLRGSISSIKSVIDPRMHNGAPLVGLRKVVVKSHGSSDYLGFSNAISMAVGLARSGFIENVTGAISSIRIG
jgi:glycerol-3-phosphate acyltransferase PlsX